MMINGYPAVDFQVHSLRSHDGKASIIDMCEKAVSVGIDEIGFTEHKDFDPADPVVDHFDYDAYMREIRVARLRFGDKLKIRAGVEIDYQIWFEDKIGAYLDSHAFDFIMGSVHYVNRVKIMTDEYNRTRNARLAYRDYFHAVRDSVVSGMFDVVGHLEYANKLGIAAWGPYIAANHVSELETIFDRMIDERVCLEINTAGLVHGTGSTYPCRDTVALYVSRGGERISIGSDSHAPDNLGFNYGAAVEIVHSVGLNNVTVWEKRNPISVPLTKRH